MLGILAIPVNCKGQIRLGRENFFKIFLFILIVLSQINTCQMQNILLRWGQIQVLSDSGMDVFYLCYT